MKITIRDFMNARHELYCDRPKTKIKLCNKIIQTIELSNGRYEVTYYIDRWLGFFRMGKTDRCSVNGEILISVT